MQASKALEEQEFQTELARRRTMGRVSTKYIMGDLHDVELGPIGPNQAYSNGEGKT